MSHPCALFIDLRRVATQPAWPDRAVTVVYLVAHDVTRTQIIFDRYQNHISTVSHVTVEVTDPACLPCLIAHPAVTRLSVPVAWITPEILHSGTSIDAIIHWDHRRRMTHHVALLDKLIDQGITHISLYGLQDFALWQEMQDHLNTRGLFFYERFHASTPDAQSPYQNHLAGFGDVIAWGGWSRVTEEGRTRTRGPRAIEWQALDHMTQCEERYLLGLSNRRGVFVDNMTPEHIIQATQTGLAMVDGDRLRPTDRGLWHVDRLVNVLTS